MAFFGKDITAADLAAGRLQGSEKEKSEFHKAFRQGIDQPTENIATTLEALGFDTQAKNLRGLVDAPEDYESASARFMKPEGEWYDFSWKDLPLATVEQAGQLGGSLLTRVAGAGIGAGVAGPMGAIVGGLLGPGLFEAVQIAGPVALERARNNNREEPNWEDWSGALGAAGVSGVLNALGVKNIGLLNSAVGTTLKAGVTEGVTEGLQGLTEQVGSTGLTEAGLQIDPKQVLGEAFLGTSAGTTIQGPIATAQAVKNMADTVKPPLSPQEQIAEAVREEVAAYDPAQEAEQVTEMLQQPFDLEEEIRDMPVERQQTYRNLAQQNTEILEEQTTPEDTERSPVHAFLESQDPIVDQYIEEQVLPNNNFTEAEMMTIRSQVNDFVGSNFELFDPTDPRNTPAQVTTLLLDQIDEAVTTRKRQAQEQLISSQADMRFEAPMNPVENIWLNPETQQPKIAEGPRAEGITSLMAQGIDPVFLIKGKLIPHLANLPNKPMSAEEAMNYLSIKQTDNWFVPKSGISQSASAHAREAIDSGVANFLRNRKANNQPVTKEEIAARFNDYIGRFRTIKTQFTTQGYEHIANLAPEEVPHGSFHLFDMEDIPGFSKIDDGASWTMYDARGPVMWEESGGRESSNPYINPLSDSTHNPHGKGTVFWNRGPTVTEEGVGTGAVIGEAQSQIHEHAQDKDYDEVYRSKVIEEDSPEMESIGRRMRALDEAQGSVLVPLKNWLAGAHVSGLLEERMGKNRWRVPSRLDSTDRGDTLRNMPPHITQIIKGDGAFKDVSRGSNLYFRNDIYEILKVASPEYMQQKKALDGRQRQRSIEIFKEAMVDEEAYAELGVNLTPQKIEQILETRRIPPDTPVDVWGAVNGYVKAVEGQPLDQRSAEPDIKEAYDRFFKILTDSERNAAIEFDAEQTQLARDYMPQLAQVVPEINNIEFAVRAYPTEEEVKRYRDWSRREQRNVVPDYPFKKNWPRINLITGIVNALDNPTLDFVYFTEKPYDGPPKAYSDMLKAAKNIANQFGDQGVTLTEVPNTGDFAGGKVYRLDIRPIREMVRNGTFPGFEGGYKYGGLIGGPITKAQGAGYNVNYGDYGRGYV
jgi:hypothetical protein